jgi:hypothetical protein
MIWYVSSNLFSKKLFSPDIKILTLNSHCQLSIVGYQNLGKAQTKKVWTPNPPVKIKLTKYSCFIFLQLPYATIFNF